MTSLRFKSEAMIDNDGMGERSLQGTAGTERRDVQVDPYDIRLEPALVNPLATSEVISTFLGSAMTPALKRDTGNRINSYTINDVILIRGTDGSSIISIEISNSTANVRLDGFGNALSDDNINKAIQKIIDDGSDISQSLPAGFTYPDTAVYVSRTSAPASSPATVPTDKTIEIAPFQLLLSPPLNNQFATEETIPVFFNNALTKVLKQETGNKITQYSIERLELSRQGSGTAPTDPIDSIRVTESRAVVRSDGFGNTLSPDEVLLEIQTVITDGTLAKEIPAQFAYPESTTFVTSPPSDSPPADSPTVRPGRSPQVSAPNQLNTELDMQPFSVRLTPQLDALFLQHSDTISAFLSNAVTLVLQELSNNEIRKFEIGEIEFVQDPNGAFTTIHVLRSKATVRLDKSGQAPLYSENSIYDLIEQSITEGRIHQQTTNAFLTPENIEWIGRTRVSRVKASPYNLQFEPILDSNLASRTGFLTSFLDRNLSRDLRARLDRVRSYQVHGLDVVQDPQGRHSTIQVTASSAIVHYDQLGNPMTTSALDDLIRQTVQETLTETTTNNNQAINSFPETEKITFVASVVAPTQSPTPIPFVVGGRGNAPAPGIAAPSSSNKSKAGVIVGSIVGVLALGLILVISLILMSRRRREKYGQESTAGHIDTSSNMSTESSPTQQTEDKTKEII